MNSVAAARRFLAKAFVENLGLKLIGLVASIALFVIVHGSEDDEITIPVQLRTPEFSDRILVSDVPEDIRVTLRGARSILNSIERDGLPPIELTTEEASQPYYYPDRNGLGLPPGATLVRLAPASVELSWAPVAQARRRVDPFLDGELAPNLTVASTSVNPPMVEIRGPAAEVGRIDRVRTQALELTGLTVGVVERRVPLMTLPDQTDYLGVRSVLVTLHIEEQEGRRTFSDVEVSVTGATGVTLRPPAIDVHVHGPRALVDELQDNRVIAVVDVTGFDPSRGAQAVPVQLRPLPPGLTATPEPLEVLVSGTD